MHYCNSNSLGINGIFLLLFVSNLSSNYIRGPIPIELSRIGNLDTL